MDPATITAFFTGLSGLVVALVSAYRQADRTRKLSKRVKDLEDEREILLKKIVKMEGENRDLLGIREKLEDRVTELETEIRILKELRGFG